MEPIYVVAVGLFVGDLLLGFWVWWERKHHAITRWWRDNAERTAQHAIGQKQEAQAERDRALRDLKHLTESLREKAARKKAR